MHEYSFLIGIGLAASVAQSLFNFGMQREKPAVASITRQLDVPFSFFWQCSIFDEPAEFFSLLGASMILASTTSLLGQRLCCGAAGAVPSAAPSTPASASDIGTTSVADAESLSTAVPD